MTQQIDAVEQDALTNLWADVRLQRDRLGKIAEPTPKKVLSELSDTGLSVMEDLVGYFLQFRQYVSESLQDVDARLSTLEAEAEPPILGEDEANMILSLAATCEVFVRLIRDSSASINSDAEQRLGEAMLLVERVREWVGENTADADDDADEDDEPEAEVEAEEDEYESAAI
jgi:hypothetical protein